MIGVEEVACKALELVSNSESKSMIGARLGALLKVSFPDFSPILYKTRNLRQFVRVYVPSLRETPHAGVDVLFTPTNVSQSESSLVVPHGTAPVPTSFVKLPIDSRAWRVYSNPSHVEVVVVNKDSREVSTADHAAPILLPWIALAKPNSAFHKSVAVDFAATQTGSVKAQLNAILDETYWYRQFTPMAKKMNVGGVWASFRIGKLSAELERSLAEHGIPLASLRRRELGAETVPSTSPEGEDIDSRLRDLVVRVLPLLTLDDLRALRLPLGLVVDAVLRK